MTTEYADTTLIVELDVTRKELKAKNEFLGEMKLDLKVKQDELSKIQEEFDVTMKAKNESLGEMKLDLKGKQDELSKIQKEFEKYKMLHECMLQILSNI